MRMHTGKQASGCGIENLEYQDVRLNTSDWLVQIWQMTLDYANAYW